MLHAAIKSELLRCSTESNHTRIIFPVTFKHIVEISILNTHKQEKSALDFLVLCSEEDGKVDIQ